MSPVLSVCLFLVLTGLAAKASVPAEPCGGTYQSFWQLDSEKKSLNLKAVYRHPEFRFCERSMTQSPNAEVFLLDSSKKSIRSFKTSFSRNIYLDVKVDGSLSGFVRKQKSSVIQIKFADNPELKKAKFLKVVFVDGSIYGPANF